MIPFTRGAGPRVLREHCTRIGREFKERGGRFQWPRVDGESLGDVARAVLRREQEAHCAFCDGFDFEAQSGTPPVEHFRPTSKFPKLAAAWTNLFLACPGCNNKKGDQFEAELLRPDAMGFRFERYFSFNPAAGTLEPSPAASDHDQRRAAATIRIFGLNREELVSSRRRAFRQARNPAEDRAYRFIEE